MEKPAMIVAPLTPCPADVFCAVRACVEIQKWSPPAAEGGRSCEPEQDLTWIPQ